MSYIKPTMTEQLFLNFFKLDPTRPYYYILVQQVARNIFVSLGQDEKVEEMRNVIFEYVEQPLCSDYNNIVFAYDDYRFAMKNKAYCKIGDEIEYVEVTRMEIKNMLEKVRIWIYDEIIMLSHEIRFTKPNEIYT